jgi:hypothetical protein
MSDAKEPMLYAIRVSFQSVSPRKLLGLLDFIDKNCGIGESVVELIRPLAAWTVKANHPLRLLTTMPARADLPWFLDQVSSVPENR